MTWRGEMDGYIKTEERTKKIKGWKAKRVRYRKGLEVILSAGKWKGKE